MSVLWPRRDEDQVSCLESLPTAAKLNLERARDDMANVTLATPMRHHLSRVLDQSEDSGIDSMKLVSDPGGG